MTKQAEPMPVNVREERRTLKQQLFTIRRYVDGEDVKMTKELEALKAKYESLTGFTNWTDFPDKWDVGDPHSVKKGAYAFNEVDQKNFERAFGKPYETIVHKIVPIE